MTSHFSRALVAIASAGSLLLGGATGALALEHQNSPSRPAKSSPGALVVSQSFGTAQKDGKVYETYSNRVGVLKPSMSLDEYYAQITPQASTAQCEDDAAFIVKVCGQVLYNARTSGGLRYVNIYQGVSSGTSNDTTSVRNSLSWRIFQTGACLSGCTGTPTTENYGSQSKPGNGTAYSQTTNFGSKYQRVSSNPFDIAGIYTTLNYSFRATPYNVTAYVRIPYL